MRKISFGVLALMMAGVSCGGSSGESSSSAGEGSASPGDNSPAASASSDDELAGHPGKTAMSVTKVDLVSDEEGTKMIDPNLKNAWGLAFNPAGAAWVSANETGVSPVYDANGNLKLTVMIPTPEGVKGPASPTGQVFNGQNDDFKGDAFIFVTEQGTIAGWQPSDETTAVMRVDNSKKNAIYKGVTIANMRKKPADSAKGDPQKVNARLFATDFHNNKIDVYDDNYRPIKMRDDAFHDDALPKGYAPFNVMAHDTILFVTYALQDENAEDDVAGAGNGFVDVYDLNGRLLDRLISQGALNAPWGLAMMPQTTPQKTTQSKNEPSKLLVGNFGDGRINVYDLTLQSWKLDAKSAGQILDQKRRPLTIDGLWAIAFGPGAGGFDADDLYFTAGPSDEEHGLFGKLVFNKNDKGDKK